MLNISLYIHIPYCKSKCNYCNFYSVVSNKVNWQQYLLALEKEIITYKGLLKERCVQTLYIGGGTPSILPNEFYKRLMKTLKKNCFFSKDLEFTIEVNPNTITEEKCKFYKNLGVNRVSVGGQSCNDKLLALINRSHSYMDFERAIATIKKYFTNFNVDLMIGLPTQTINDVKSSIKNTIKFKPSHISCYSLILEKGTPLYKNTALVKDIPNEEMQIKMYDIVFKKLKNANFERYEVSNFALKSKKDSNISKHNKNYWIGGDYLGLGAAAHSFVDGKRWNNVSDINKYVLENYKVKKSNITNKQLIEERIMLGLRTKWGVDKNICNLSEIDFLIKNKFIKLTNNNIIATNKGVKVLNQIILKLI